jgi:hypothetical protein
MSFENTRITKSVQIVKIEGSKFIFDFEAFQDIINQNEQTHDLPVAVIVINGALRTGKSFFSNFIIRHLKNTSLESSSVINKNYKITQDDVLKDYFTSRRGATTETLGIWVFNEIFIHEGKAIILMDTQGIFDQELNQAMTIALISLSTIMSSYQIYNLDKRIQEDHLCNMAYFSAYSDLISNTSNTKIGQTLCLLVRDWQNFENNFDLERCDSETENYRTNFLDNGPTCKDKSSVMNRKKILDTYDDVVVRLCPHPGHLVTEGKFSGRLTEVREDFLIHVDHIVRSILKNLKPKRISNDQDLLCRELPKYMKEYITLYENVKEALPEAMTILETTKKICQDNAKTKTVHFYKENMLSQIKTKKMTTEDIEAWHNNCFRESNKYFNRMYIMGKDEDIRKIKELVMIDINDEYSQFLLMAQNNRHIFDTMIDVANNYLKTISMMDWFHTNNPLFILFFLFMFTKLLPMGGEFIVEIIKYSLCFACGMFMYRASQASSPASGSSNINNKFDNNK